MAPYPPDFCCSCAHVLNAATVGALPISPTGGADSYVWEPLLLRNSSTLATKSLGLIGF
jgi:hypothetical protein